VNFLNNIMFCVRVNEVFAANAPADAPGNNNVNNAGEQEHAL
jgi:hypothetical protein